MEGQITFAKASSIKIGDYFCIGNYPCKCVQMDTSKPGKHGACKIHFVGIDILTGKKHDLISPSTKDVTVPVVTKKEYLLLDLIDEEDKTGNNIAYCSLMYQGKTCDNIKLPDSDIGKSIKEAFESLNADKDIFVTVMEVMEQEIITSYKITKA